MTAGIIPQTKSVAEFRIFFNFSKSQINMSRRSSENSENSKNIQSGDELGPWPSLQGTPQETTSLTFPSMALPPGRFRINDRETLEHYLRQSPILLQAYSGGGCVSDVFEDDHSVDFQVLQQWGRDYDVNHFDSLFAPAVEEAMRGSKARPFLFSLFLEKEADLVGIMFLNEVFSGWLMMHPDSSDVTGLLEIFRQAVRGLEAKERPPPAPRTVFAQGLDTAFDAVFMDPHDMVSYYAHDLQRLWKVWSENPTQYIAPYTSIVTSSMMGKSRLMKEMASFIPTIYICLRETGEAGQQVEGERFVDAYPERSPDKVINYLFNEPQSTESGDIKRHYVCFFIGVLEAMAFWIHSVISESSPGDESAIDINKRLWRTLAEPSAAVTEWSTKFWTIAINRARKFHAANEDSRSLQNLVRSNWNNLRKFLKGLNMLGDDPVPLLFFVFDEARPLVKFGPNGKIIHQDEEISRFHLLRRALQEVGMSGKKTDPVMSLLAFSPYLRTRHPRLPAFNPVAKHRESRGTTSCLQSSYCQRSTIMQTIVCKSRTIQRRLQNLNGCFILGVQHGIPCCKAARRTRHSCISQQQN